MVGAAARGTGGGGRGRADGRLGRERRGVGRRRCRRAGRGRRVRGDRVAPREGLELVGDGGVRRRALEGRGGQRGGRVELGGALAQTGLTAPARAEQPNDDLLELVPGVVGGLRAL